MAIPVVNGSDREYFDIYDGEKYVRHPLKDAQARTDLSSKADKTDTVLDTTLSRGRKANTTVGTGSFAFGDEVEASENNSFAEGNHTIASGTNSHAEGYFTTASGNGSHAENNSTIASGLNSHAQGFRTIANANSQHVMGRYNIEDDYSSWQEWVANTSYVVGDKVKRTSGNTVYGYICRIANSDASFTTYNWSSDTQKNYAEIVGNGTANNVRSNARALDWDGNERLMGDVYVGCNADSTGGTKLAKVTDIPSVPVTDVQVDGTSVVSNGVANVDISGKLNAPTTSGTSGQVLTSNGNGGQVWANVGTGSIVIDPTLSVAGAAADAKACGSLKSATNAIDACDTDGFRRVVNFINGLYNKDTLAYSTNAKRICTSGMVSVKKGDTISVDKGSYSFQLYLYEGTPTSYKLIRDDNTNHTVNETIVVYADGFFYAMFADPTSPNTTNVYADQFDGSVTVTSYAMTKADAKQLSDYKDGYAVTHLNVLDDSILVSTLKYWSKRSGTSILTLSTPGGTATYYSYLVPVDGESVYTFKNQVRYIFPVAADGVTALANAVELATSIDTSQYTGCAYIAISVRSDTYDMSAFCVSKGSAAKKENTYTYPAWFSGKFDPLEDQVDGLDDELEAFEDGYEVVNLNLLEDLTPTSTTQYYYKSTQTGKLVLSTASTATYNSWLVPVDGTSKYTMSYITRYIYAVQEDGETVIGSAVELDTSIDTSNYTGCKYIAISARNDDAQYPMSSYYVSKGNVARTGTETIPPAWMGDKLDEMQEQINSLDVKPKRNKIYMLTDTSFSAEKNFADFKTSVKGKCLHLVVNPSSFTSITVGLRDTTRAVFYAKVTSDSVYLYDYNGGLTEHTQTYTHGLTIADNLSIDVYAAANTGAYYVRVGTNGTEYVTPAAFNIAPTGLIYPYASMEGSATFVQFCVECNTQRPIWMFGDSYHGTLNTARWAYYLVNREQDSRVMMDSYAGENSTSAYASLEALIECGVPDYIVWCLGMNDGGDTGTTPNNTWLGKIESMIALCEANNITPILATVPTVPSVNNEGKNAWVRESGYQYIDFAKAVGASDQGVWFDGMLSTDNVHPSVTGAITLYHAALAGCPQFSQK